MKSPKCTAIIDPSRLDSLWFRNEATYLKYKTNLGATMTGYFVLPKFGISLNAPVSEKIALRFHPRPLPCKRDRENVLNHQYLFSVVCGPIVLEFDT